MSRKWDCTWFPFSMAFFKELIIFSIQELTLYMPTILSQLLEKSGVAIICTHPLLSTIKSYYLWQGPLKNVFWFACYIIPGYLWYHYHSPRILSVDTPSSIDCIDDVVESFFNMIKNINFDFNGAIPKIFSSLGSIFLVLFLAPKWSPFQKSSVPIPFLFSSLQHHLIWFLNMHINHHEIKHRQCKMKTNCIIKPLTWWIFEFVMQKKDDT